MELRHPHDAISALLGASVANRDGSRLGRVRDVIAHRAGDGSWRVTHLLVAGRLGRRPREIPWSDIADRDDGLLRLR